MSHLGCCITGQVLSISLAVASFGVSGIKTEYWKFCLLGLIYFGQFIFGQILITISKMNRHSNFDLYVTFICGICDFLGNICLLFAYEQPISSCIVIFISQLLFPKLVLIKRIVLQRREDVSVYRLLAFLTIITASFCINWSIGSQLEFNLFGAMLAFISNFFFAAVILMQGGISEKDPIFYVRDYSAVAFIFGLFVSLILDYRGPTTVLLFYSQNWINIAMYGLFITFYYLLSVFFIKKYGGISFNASVLSYSTYFGILSLISAGQFSAPIIAGFAICIASTLILVITGLKKEKCRICNQ